MLLLWITFLQDTLGIFSLVLTDVAVSIIIFTKKRSSIMLESIAIILLVLWLLGLVSSYTLGGFIHILLVLAVVMILVRLISGRRL